MDQQKALVEHCMVQEQQQHRIHAQDCVLDRLTVL